MNIRGEYELATNQAEAENQASLVPGPDPDQMKNFKKVFKKIKSATMPVHHVKGQPDRSTYVRKMGVITFYTNCRSPCIMERAYHLGLDRLHCSAVCGPIWLILWWIVGVGHSYLANCWCPDLPPGAPLECKMCLSQLYVGQLG